MCYKSNFIPIPRDDLFLHGWHESELPRSVPVASALDRTRAQGLAMEEESFDGKVFVWQPSPSLMVPFLTMHDHCTLDCT